MDRNLEIKIDLSLSGKSVKEIMKNRLLISTAIMTEMKNAKDGILLSGKKVFVTERVKEGDVLSLHIKDGTSDLEAWDFPLDILYEDEDIIAVNKMRKMPTHPSQNHRGDTLANALMHYFCGKNFTFRAITRLDKDTSGVTLLAKNPLSAAILGENMKKGCIKKEYMALTMGTPEPLSGEINAPIGRREKSVILRCVRADGKEAKTIYETVKSENGLSLVKLNPLTGRTHQIRVHLSYIGNPIYGDYLYGAPQKDEATRLHCSKITFIHPITRKEMAIEAPLPSDMEEVIK